MTETLLPANYYTGEMAGIRADGTLVSEILKDKGIVLIFYKLWNMVFKKFFSETNMVSSDAVLYSLINLLGLDLGTCFPMVRLGQICLHHRDPMCYCKGIG